MTHAFNPLLDLELQVQVPLTAEQLFQGWTDPETLKKWFCPRPWKVIDCHIDLRPGGSFRNTMQSPEGENMPENKGCYLWVDQPHRLVWTNLMTEDFRPNPSQFLGFGFVCDLKFQTLPTGGSMFHATLQHADEEGRTRHEQMGFEQGWRTALAQLVELHATH
jgi:uncharacterized protein YndB with AHSA1/START domain